MKGFDSIKFKGIWLDVHYEYDKYYPATYETPEEGGDVNVYSVEVQGENIIELLSEETIDKIIEQISKNYD